MPISNSNGKLRIVFYNVENLFDINDNPETNDDEFTPEGEKRWSYSRLSNKYNNIYKVFIALGGWDLPAIAGLAEVENLKVLQALISFTPLNNAGYEIVHFDSQDERGIDVGMLYRSDRVMVDSSGVISVEFPFDKADRTRDILYTRLNIFNSDVLHVFINHWPSRSGGVLASRKKRIFVADLLRNEIDSVLESDSLANILVMGDFNDEPNDESIKEHLIKPLTEKEPNQMVNLTTFTEPANTGTLKYKGNWFIFDQFLGSFSLLEGNNGIMIKPGSISVFAPDFLLVEDSKNIGCKPFRTYNGPSYIGGYSDHLPIYLDIIKVNY